MPTLRIMMRAAPFKPHGGTADGWGMDAGGRLLSGGTAADAADGRAGGPAGCVDQAGAAERVGGSARRRRERTHDGRIEDGGGLWLRPG